MFKFGIIGAGNIAHNFCDAVRYIDGAEVTAVSSKDIDRAMEFAKKESISSYYDDYGRMLTDSDIDAVYIATTHNYHYENALLCLNCGKPVLIEKPMVLGKKQATEIFELAGQKKLFVMEAMWSRFLPHVNQARDWVNSGRLGKLAIANCVLGFKADKDPHLRYFNPDLAGGAVYDIGVYVIELMSYVINEPVRDVQTMIIRADTGVDLTDNISIRFDTCIANLQTTFAANVPCNAVIYGEEGYIVIPSIHTGNECFLYQNNEMIEHFKGEYKNGFVYQVEETIRCIREGLLESPVVPHVDTLMCCEIFDQALSFM